MRAKVEPRPQSKGSAAIYLGPPDPHVTPSESYIPCFVRESREGLGPRTVGPPYNENFGTVNIFHYSEVFIIENIMVIMVGTQT